MCCVDGQVTLPIRVLSKAAALCQTLPTACAEAARSWLPHLHVSKFGVFLWTGRHVQHCSTLDCLGCPVNVASL